MHLPMAISVNTIYHPNYEEHAKKVYAGMFKLTQKTLNIVGLNFTNNGSNAKIDSVEHKEDRVIVHLSTTFGEEFTENEREDFNALMSELNKRLYK